MSGANRPPSASAECRVDSSGCSEERERHAPVSRECGNQAGELADTRGSDSRSQTERGITEYSAAALPTSNGSHAICFQPNRRLLSRRFTPSNPFQKDCSSLTLSGLALVIRISTAVQEKLGAPMPCSCSSLSLSLSSFSWRVPSLALSTTHLSMSSSSLVLRRLVIKPESSRVEFELQNHLGCSVLGEGESEGRRGREEGGGITAVALCGLCDIESFLS